MLLSAVSETALRTLLTIAGSLRREVFPAISHSRRIAKTAASRLPVILDIAENGVAVAMSERIDVKPRSIGQASEILLILEMETHMTSIRISCFLKVMFFAGLLLASPTFAADENVKSLLDVSADGVEKTLTSPTKDQVTISRSQDVPGVIFAIAAGPADYPGVSLKLRGAAVWDLSAFDHIEIAVTNMGPNAAPFGVNVENSGKWQDAPWNTEEMIVEPGKTQTLSVYFGFSFGREPGYKLKTDAVSCLRIYTKKADAALSFRIESIKAAGTAKK